MIDIKFDVMLHGTFICTLTMAVNPLFPISDDEITKFVINKRPTLKGKDFNIVF